MSSSVQWFTAQQQTSTNKPQKCSACYSKFSVDLSELTPSSQNAYKVAWKKEKLNDALKT